MKVSSIRLINRGSGYTRAPRVVFSTGDASAKALISIEGQVYGLEVIQGGSGYHYPPEVEFEDGGGGDGAAAECIMAD